ncbi:Hypothetical predicted protein [Paramuricea clavata]|uniref:Uncharacterized protein n=1 Tax=Paramuricea clavata TaxID=317549 RepID=A0A7D9LLH2_PARCT|nr:Hypothetical predicted protein [Paramuricea clavata]
MASMITRTREMTPDLKNQIDGNTIHLCERHFKSECISIYPTRKVLILGSIPTENLPKKSHEDPKPAQPRRSLTKRDSTVDTATATSSLMSLSTCSRSNNQFKSLLKQIDKENLDPWKIDKSVEEKVKFELYDDVHCLPKFTIVVDSALEFSTYVYNWPLEDTHFLYKERK